jgi:hypothetical protein
MINIGYYSGQLPHASFIINLNLLDYNIKITFFRHPIEGNIPFLWLYILPLISDVVQG